MPEVKGRELGVKRRANVEANSKDGENVGMEECKGGRC